MRPIDIYEGLAKVMGLSDEDLAIQRGWEALWPNEVRWARQALVDEGHIIPTNQSQHGLWRLADNVMDRSSTLSSKLTDSRLREDFPKIQDDLKEEGVFDPANLADARDTIVRAIVQRRGQASFRQKLLTAYHFKCCISGTETVQVLEAAHIVPYRGDHTNSVQNGLLLRADLHTLFDLHLLSIDPGSFRIDLAPSLHSSHYAAYSQMQLSLPHDIPHHPSKDALAQHRSQCGF